MPIETLSVSDAAFDAALERFAVVSEMIVPKTELGREPERKEILDRYAFTAFVEALRSDEFIENPFETAAELELEREFESEEDAWDAILEFYASRDCVLLIVGEFEEFVVGREIVDTLGLERA